MEETIAEDDQKQTEASPESPASIDDPLRNAYASLNDLCFDLSALLDLAYGGAWRTVLDKVARTRSLSQLSKPHEHLVYLTFNVLGLIKLRRFSDANQELQTLFVGGDDLNSSQYLYQSYPNHYPNLQGSMVPFILRWIYAYLPSALGSRLQSLDRLYSLLDFVRIKKSSRSDELWRKREVFVINTILSYHLSQKDFKVCLDLLVDLVGKRGCGDDPTTLSKVGYVQMQYGDLEGAKRTFKAVEEMVGADSTTGLRNLVGRNKALMYIVDKDYVSAVREYEECVERDGMDVVSINNKALCLMYLRDLADSIKVLENALERIPTVALNETLVMNLCSMYELAYVNHADIKRTLSNWIARVASDDFDSSSTRV